MNILYKLNEIEGVDFSSIEYQTGWGNVCLGITTDLSFEELDPKVMKVLEDNCKLLRMEANSIHKMEANPNLLKDCHYRHYPIYPLMDIINTIPYNARVLSKGAYYVPAKYASDEILTENAVLADQIKETTCPDCKDGFYYPLIGPPELCQTCKPTDVIPDPTCNDFQNLLLERLKNIDLSPIKVVLGHISNPTRCSINLIIRDGESFLTIDDYYEYFSTRLRQDFKNQQFARLDFTDAKILTTYHVPTSGILMSFYYRRETFHAMP